MYKRQDLGIENEFVQKSGSFFSYGDIRLGQGRNNSKQFLQENPDIALELENKILAKAGVSRDSDVRNADQFAAEAAAKEAEENPVKEAPAPKVEAVEEEEKKAA